MQRCFRFAIPMKEAPMCSNEYTAMHGLTVYEMLIALDSARFNGPFLFWLDATNLTSHRIGIGSTNISSKAPQENAKQ